MYIDNNNSYMASLKNKQQNKIIDYLNERNRLG